MEIDVEEEDMVVIFVYLILLIVYAVCPFLLQIAGFVLNAMYPDPIPFIDEIVMVFCMMNRLEKIMMVLEAIFGFIAEHKVIVISICIIAAIVGIFVYQNGGVPSFGR